MAFQRYASAQIIGAYGSKTRLTSEHLAGLKSFDEWDNYLAGKDDFLYVRVRAISSRVNQNHDGWPAEELQKAYRSFIGKPLFIDHHNSDPARTRGVVVDAKLHIEDTGKVSSLDPYYTTAPENHKPPTWVELLLEVDAKSFPRLARAIINKDIDGVSMGANVEYTTCGGHCGNRAEDPTEFCEHIRNKGAYYDARLPDGTKTSRRSYEDCYGVGFFELSFVFDPADNTALIRDLKHAKTASIKAAIQSEATNHHALSDVFGGLDSNGYLRQIAKEAWDKSLLKEAPDPESNAWNAVQTAVRKAGFPQEAVEIANDMRESYQQQSDQIQTQVNPETQGYDETWIGHPEAAPLHPSLQEMIYTKPNNAANPTLSHKTAENAPPQVDLTTVPQKVDTLRNEEPCLLCGNTMEQGKCGVCFTPETPVRTIDGWIPIASIEPGDLVLSEDGDFHKVLEIQERDYHGFIQELTTHGSFDPIRVTPEHPFKRVVGHHSSWKEEECQPNRCNRSITGHDKWGNQTTSHDLEWVEAQNLTTDHYIKQNFPSTNRDRGTIPVPKEFRGAQRACNSCRVNKGKNGACQHKTGYRRSGPTEFELTPDFLWMIGIYIAEGSSGDRTINFALHRNETEYQDRLLSLFRGYGYSAQLVLRKDTPNSAWVEVYSSTLAEWFPAWLGHECQNKRIPSEIFLLPSEKLDFVIQGIYDGDGNKAFHNGLGQTSYQIALQVNEYSMRIGGTPTSCIDQQPNKKREYTVTGVKTAILNPVGKVQKQKRFTWKIHGVNTVKIKSNTLTPYCGKVYNLTVEDDHTYTVQNILVHNCGYEKPPEGLDNPDLTQANPQMQNTVDSVPLPQPQQQNPQQQPMNAVPSGGMPPNGQGQGGTMGVMGKTFGTIYSAMGFEEQGADDPNWQGLEQVLMDPDDQMADSIIGGYALDYEVQDLLAQYGIPYTSENKAILCNIAEQVADQANGRKPAMADYFMDKQPGRLTMPQGPPESWGPAPQGGMYGSVYHFGAVYIDPALIKTAAAPNLQGGRINTNEKPLLPVSKKTTDRPLNQRTMSDSPKPVISKQQRTLMPNKTADSNGASAPAGAEPQARVDVTQVGGVSGVEGNEPKGSDEYHNRLIHQDLLSVGGEKLNDDPPQVDVGGPLKQELGEPTSTWTPGRGDSAGQHNPVTNKGLDMYNSAFNGIQHTALMLTGDPLDGIKSVDVAADLAQEVGPPTSTWGTDSFHTTDPVTNEHFPTDGVSDSGKAVHHPSEKATMEELQSGESDPMGSPAGHSESEKSSLEELQGGGTTSHRDIRSHIIKAMKIAEVESALGITNPSVKFERAAELEREHEGALNARLDAYVRVRQAGLRKPLPRQASAAIPAMPSMATIKEAGLDEDRFDLEAASLFS